MAAYKDLTPDGLLASVKQVDKRHKLGSRFPSVLAKSFEILEELMRSVSIAIQSNPEISSLVIGGARLVLDVALKFTTFFGKLANMIIQLSEYLEVLDTFVKRLEKDGVSKSDKILKCVANLYTDWLDFGREVCRTFKDKKETFVRFVSIRIFLRVQWDPFYTAPQDRTGQEMRSNILSCVCPVGYGIFLLVTVPFFYMSRNF